MEMLKSMYDFTVPGLSSPKSGRLCFHMHEGCNSCECSMMTEPCQCQGTT